MMNPLWHRLAAEYGTPFYAYDLDAPRQRAAELQSIFPRPDRARLLYSFKSNPLPAVAGELRAAGCRADLTSEGELHAAIEAGFDLSEALYGGPGKGAMELATALAHGVERFSIESWNDLETLAQACRSQGRRATALLRVNPSEPPKARVAMAGVASQFGFEEESLTETTAPGRIAEVADVIDVAGFHIYWGTQVGDVEALAASFASAVSTAEHLSAYLDIPLRFLNLGGGFPWPYAHQGTGPDLTPLREELQRIHENAGRARDAEWWFESGRYLAASSGTLVSRVMDVKESKGRHFVILDTGIHHLGGMAGLGRIPRFSVDLESETVVDSEQETPVDLVGQLCTPLDCLARNLSSGPLQPGDLVAIPNTGAYGLTASVVGFLSRPVALEIAHRGDTIESIHRLRSGHECIQGSVSPPVEGSLPSEGTTSSATAATV